MSDHSASSGNDFANRRTSSRISESTAWLAPERPPKLGRDGKYIRPFGPAPVEGYSWNVHRGVWVPGAELFASAPSSKKTKRKPRKKKVKLSQVSDLIKNMEPQHRLLEGYQDTGDVDHDPSPSPSSYRSDEDELYHKGDVEPPPSKNDDEEFEPDPEDTLDDSNNEEDTLLVDGDAGKGKKRKASSLTLQPPEEDGLYHPYSEYREPPPHPDDLTLTLYEKHRMPRPAPTGQKTISCKAVTQEFRCVICLDFIENSRIVKECLHRFCESCIEKCLSNEKKCPICRVAVPSRRSLVVDAAMDSIRSCILKDRQVRYDDPPSQILQQAIAKKRSHHEVFDDDPIVQCPPPSLVRIHLRNQSKKVPALQFPYLKLTGDATVSVLRSFLRQKLGTRYEVKCDDGTNESLDDYTRLDMIVHNTPYLQLYYS